MEQQPTYQSSQPNNKRRMVLIVSVIVGLFLLLILLIGLNSAKFKNYSLYDTGLMSDSMFGHISDNDIYAYNGLAFYKIDYETGQSTILSDGIRLPHPKTLVWANDKGVLLNFDRSYYLSLVDDVLTKKGLKIDATTREYTWYFNFADGSLSLVNKLPLKGSPVFFDESQNGYYYLIDTANSADIRFFNISNLSDSLVASGVGIEDISYFGSCSGYRACLIGYSSGDFTSERLFGVDDNNKINEILNSKDRLYATNYPNLFLTASALDNSGAVVTDVNDEDADQGKQPVLLHNLQTGEEKKLGFDLGESDIAAVFSSQNDFSVFDGSITKNILSNSSEQFYRLGTFNSLFGRIKTAIKPLLFADGKSFKSAVLTNPDTNSTGDALVTSFAGNQYLFTDLDEILGFDVISSNEAQLNVQRCGQESKMKDVDYFSESSLFKVYFSSDSKLADNIKTFSDCLGQTNTHGYLYYFGALDSRSGRIVTD